MNMPEHSMNHYHLTNEIMLGNQQWEGKEDMLSIVMLGLANELPPEGDDKYELHRLLGALLSETLAQEQKLNIIEKEYDIPLENGIRKELDSMCNLSQGIEERAEERAEKRAEERIIMNMFERDFPVDQIAIATQKSVDEVREIIDSKQAILV
jgi:hypothetical protein